MPARFAKALRADQVLKTDNDLKLVIDEANRRFSEYLTQDKVEAGRTREGRPRDGRKIKFD
jgi:hypothetical protein